MLPVLRDDRHQGRMRAQHGRRGAGSGSPLERALRRLADAIYSPVAGRDAWRYPSGLTPSTEDESHAQGWQ